uniref:ATP synthase F0 subunit 8 n=1 Tax=Neojurtina typica TaxID=2880911 RepID=UPI001D108E06|nr:ATP synthase F0 subunit 8 [Neojurtina typica]UCC46055.1 ATP synthase F0 subunit 8 [Neojurtina typica]
MPQMSPMWWEILFLVFTLSFILINIFIYHYKQEQIKYKSSSKLNMSQYNWMW